MVGANKAVEDVGCEGHGGWDREKMAKKTFVLVGMLRVEGFLMVIGPVESLGCPGYTTRCIVAKTRSKTGTKAIELK